MRGNNAFDLKVPNGPASIEARVDWGRSRPLREASPDRQIDIEVSNRWGALLAIWAVTFGFRSDPVLRRLPLAAPSSIGPVRQFLRQMLKVATACEKGGLCAEGEVIRSADGPPITTSSVQGAERNPAEGLVWRRHKCAIGPVHPYSYRRAKLHSPAWEFAMRQTMVSS